MLVAFTEKCVCLPFRARTPCRHLLMRMLQESVVTFPSNPLCYWIECWIEVSTRSLVSEHKRALVSFLLVCLVSHGQLRNKTMFACLSFWKQKFRSLTIPRYTFSFESYCWLPSRRMLLCRSPILKSNFGLGTEGRLVLCSVFLGGGNKKNQSQVFDNLLCCRRLLILTIKYWARSDGYCCWTTAILSITPLLFCNFGFFLQPFCNIHIIFKTFGYSCMEIFLWWYWWEIRVLGCCRQK